MAEGHKPQDAPDLLSCTTCFFEGFQTVIPWFKKESPSKAGTQTGKEIRDWVLWPWGLVMIVCGVGNRIQQIMFMPFTVCYHAKKKGVYAWVYQLHWVCIRFGRILFFVCLFVCFQWKRLIPIGRDLGGLLFSFLILGQNYPRQMDIQPFLKKNCHWSSTHKSRKVGLPLVNSIQGLGYYYNKAFVW